MPSQAFKGLDEKVLEVFPGGFVWMLCNPKVGFRLDFVVPEKSFDDGSLLFFFHKFHRQGTVRLVLTWGMPA